MSPFPLPYGVSSAAFKSHHLSVGSFCSNNLPLEGNFTAFPCNFSVDLVESAIKPTLKGGQGLELNSGES